jgi:putative exporter of polyketide antibiotics
MQCKSIGLRLVCLAALAPLVCLLAGCEFEPADRRIKISPDSATIIYGKSVTLNAMYGYVYTWSLSDNTMGVLNIRHGSQVIYTSLKDPAAPVVQIVTVSSTFSDADESGTGTNAPVVHTAEAYITHINSTNNPWTAE